MKNDLTTSGYNKFANEILDVKIKNKKMFIESKISEFLKNTDLNWKKKK